VKDIREITINIRV